MVQAAVAMSVTPDETSWIEKLNLPLSRYVSERNALRVGMTEGGVAHVALNIGNNRAVDTLRDALRVKFRAFFTLLPTDGELYYQRIRDRYIVRQPEEMAGIFHYYLIHPEAWTDDDHRATPRYALPDQFQSFVHSVMRQSMSGAVYEAKKLLK